MRTTKLLLERDPGDKDWPDYINISLYYLNENITLYYFWQEHTLKDSIIHCCDCQYFIEDNESCTCFRTLPCADKVEIEIRVNPLGFCAWGKKRSE